MYRGRFAPSPSGHLHVGNLRTAVAAWLDARSSGGEIWLRIDDLDPDRSKPEFVTRQQEDLARLGLVFDRTVFQSQHLETYRDAIATLEASGRTYRCYCTRAEIAAARQSGADEQAYPGTCAHLDAAGHAQREGDEYCVRVRATENDEPTAPLVFSDLVQGSVEGMIDDFIIIRKDGAYAYNLATAVDEATMGMTTVIRGSDLAPLTARHIWLATALGLSCPAYGHLPLVVGPDGDKLAKRHGNITMNRRTDAGKTLDRILKSLEITVDATDPHQQLEQAISHYTRENLYVTPPPFGK